MPVIAQDPITKVINIILGEGEKITEQFNTEKAVIYRRDSTTDWKLKLVKPLGLLANEEELRVNAKPVCNFDFSSDNGNPLHQHDDGTWWHFDELWQLEHGPFSTYEEAYSALADYCIELETSAATAEELANDMGSNISNDAIAKKLLQKLFPNGVPDDVIEDNS